MPGWLPEDFQADAGRMERSVAAVSGRIVRRKARVRTLKILGSATLVLTFAAVTPIILKTLRSKALEGSQETLSRK